MPNKTLEFYFKDALLEMGPLNRAIVRITISIWMIVLIILCVTLLLSDIKSFFWLGVLMLFYLLDRMNHRNQSEDLISKLPNNGKINLVRYLTPFSRRTLMVAHDRSIIEGGNFLLHLIKILLDDKGVREVLSRLDVKEEELRSKIDEYIAKESAIIYSKENIIGIISNITTRALDEAASGQVEYIDPVDIFGALSFVEDKNLIRIFELFDIKPGDVERSLIFGRWNKKRSFITRIPKTLGGFASKHLRHRVMNRAWTARPTPILDRFSIDFTDLARFGQTGFLIGHKAEYERLLNILSRPARPNALLVGEPGIGKEVVIGHLAYMIIKDKVPEKLFDKRLVALDLGGLLAGADQAEMQSRIRAVFDEIHRAGNIILYIPEIHNLSRTSGAKQISAANVIVPLIVTNEFPLIGMTYPKEYKQFIEQDSAFAGAFDVIRVNEVTKDEAASILIYESILLEKQYKVRITFEAIKTAIDIAFKYFHDRPLPGSGSDLLKEALSAASRSKIKVLDGDSIIKTAETRINIPIKRADRDEAEKLLNLEELIHKQLVNQENAVSLVSQALREYRSGLSRKGGPIGSFLFVGPTGVGKTELSKILAKLQFGSEDAMIRFDMSEYQDKTSFFQMIGSPDGSMTGILTDRVIEKPYSLILLDEFEKAHPDILNLFLQVFDDGRLTDNFGRVVNFENTIIIATSNAHSDFIKSEIESGRHMDEISGELKKKLVTFFRPELLNRFSSIVVFTSLSREDIKKISRMQLNSLSKQLKDNQGIYMTFSEALVEKIGELGYDPVFGARPLRQVMSSKIKDPLSRMILEQGSSRGISLSVDVEDGEIKIQIK